jgi:L-lactate utilization protein LutB
MVRAAEVGIAAQAVRLEQKFEEEILATAVKKLVAHRGDRVKQAQDLRELRELVRRDKRAVEMLGNVLGSSSGVSLQNYVAWCWIGSNASDMPKM